MMRLAIVCGVIILLTGCGLLPTVTHQPQLHNPFPQLTRVAIAPFINLSTEPTVDGRQFALAYFSELQAIPGFEVVPMGNVEVMMKEKRLSLNSAADVRRLAQLLGVDAVVVGAVTDFTPYYPPRCAMEVEWYTANPCFHPIPPGYGLPWGTPEEQDIPQPLVMEAEMALAREQLKTQTPDYPKEPAEPVPARRDTPDGGLKLTSAEEAAGQVSSASKAAADKRPSGNGAGHNTQAVATAQPTPASPPGAPTASDGTPIPRTVLVGGPNIAAGLPPNWPDPRGFIPLPPSCNKPQCHPSDEPVMRYTQTYQGNDPDFTASLRTYAQFRDDARFGGWGAYLQRSDDFIRFCCHKHIAAMLTARGGAGESRVVWRWSESR